SLRDAYLSVVEALRHGGIAHDAEVEVLWIPSDALEEATEEKVEELLGAADGILVPGGFGYRGIEGKIKAIRYARERKVPFFGICLGMQCAVIEFARHVVGLAQANSSEFDPTTPDPVIDLLPEQKEVEDLGGTMRLGLYPCVLAPQTRAYAAYQDHIVYERHRHRYEFNNEYRTELTAAGLVISGLSPDKRLVEIIELPDHPWFLGAQFHPEFKSRPLRPHPLFRDFVGAALQKAQQRG
ncbi:MAG: CTP synthase, partial [Bacillota bacterium]|nr:CTP synthase [Bacillota bacterium]